MLSHKIGKSPSRRPDSTSTCAKESKEEKCEHNHKHKHKHKEKHCCHHKVKEATTVVVYKPYYILLEPGTPIPLSVPKPVPIDHNFFMQRKACIDLPAAQVVPISAPMTTMVITYPGAIGGIPSYLSAAISKSPPYLNPVGTTLGGTTIPIITLSYPAWCVDVQNDISPSTTYSNILVIPTYDPALATRLAALGSGAAAFKVNNVCALNYILNRVSHYTHFLNYTFADIQNAIWHFMVGTGVTDPSAVPTLANVEAIEMDVMMNASTYRPQGAGDYFAVLVVPVDSVTNPGPRITNQMLALQVTLSHFPFPCTMPTDMVRQPELSPPAILT